MDASHDMSSGKTSPAEIPQEKFDSSVKAMEKSLSDAADKDSPAQSGTTPPTSNPSPTPSMNPKRVDLLGALDTKRGERSYRIKFSVGQYQSPNVTEILGGYGKGRFYGKVENFCTCGIVNDVNVVWEFQGQKGTFESLTHGEFIIGKFPPHKWRNNTAFEGLVSGEHNLFFGADSDGDGKCGIFECDHKHKWRDHDDIRAALVCDISQCPANQMSGTVLKVHYHPSHAAEH